MPITLTLVRAILSLTSMPPFSPVLGTPDAGKTGYVGVFQQAAEMMNYPFS
jgi:hypothetical protein